MAPFAFCAKPGNVTITDSSPRLPTAAGSCSISRRLTAVRVPVLVVSISAAGSVDRTVTVSVCGATSSSRSRCTGTDVRRSTVRETCRNPGKSTFNE
jgi:translation initiation factor 2B subunit (eIF-2B alpha/beta/delta family)